MKNKNALVLDSSLKEFQKVLDFMPDAVVVCDARGNVAATNVQTEHMLGYPASDLLGRTIETIVPARFRSAHVGHREGYMANPHVRPMGEGLDLFALRKDGTEIPVEISLGPVRTKEGMYVMATLRDATPQKEAQKILKRSKAELEDQVLRRTAEIRKLQKEILEISETEQKRIGQDLHDGPSQTMTAVAYKAQLLGKILAQKNPDQAELAGEIVELASGAMDQLRGLARGLYPVELERHGLGPALEELARVMEAQSKIPCRVEKEGSISFRHDKAIQVYRIAQEAVNNAVKHARPKSIRIGISQKSGKLRLTVSDDGIGIRTQKAGMGMGLDIMRYRAGMISANFDVEPGPDGGTIVSCTLDVADENA